MPTWYDKSTSDTLLAGKASASALTAEASRALAAEALLAPLASPAFTGTPTIGGATVAKTSDIASAIAGIVGAAPSALDTLKEIDDQLAADEGSAAALAAAVALKAPLASPAFTGTPTIGGTAVAKTTDVTAAVAAQAATDAGTYATLLKTVTTTSTATAPTAGAVTVYNASGTGYRLDQAATLTIGSATIGDAAILATDTGRPVASPQVPAGSYVGTVTAGASFTLVNAAGTAVTVTDAGGNNSSRITLGPAFNPSLPALSGLTVGTLYGVQKAETDTSSNPVVLTAAGSDLFDSGAASLSLRLPGEYRILEVALAGATKVWKIVAGGEPVTSRDARYAPQPVRADRLAFLGDSITGLNGTGDNVNTNHNYFDSFSNYLPTLLNGRVKFAGVFNTGGFTASQVRDIVLPRMLAQPVAQWPGTVVLLAGTNDVGFAVAPATTMTAFADIYAILRQRGIRLVCATIPPRGDNTTVNAAVGKLNILIQDFARANGLDCLPFHEALVNPADGKYIAGYAIADNIHPTRLGMKAMADAAITAGFANRFPVRSSVTVKSAADSTDLLGGKGLFLTDSNADGTADNWDAGGNYSAGPTRSLVTPGATDGVVGKWARMSIAAGVTGGFAYLQYNGAVTKTTPTDLLELTLKVRLTGATAGGAGSNIQFQATGGATGDATSWYSSVDITGVITTEHRMRSDDNGFRITVNAGIPSTGTLNIDVAEVGVRNLTALGLA